MGSGDAREDPHPLVRGDEVDDRLTQVLDVLAHRHERILDRVAGHLGVFADQIDAIKLIAGSAFRLAGEEELHIIGNQLPSHRIGEQCPHRWQIPDCAHDIVAHRPQHRGQSPAGEFLLWLARFVEQTSIFRRLFVEQAVLFRLLFRLLFRSLIDGRAVLRGPLAEHGVDPLQDPVAVLVWLQQLELEQRGLADQILGALHVLDTGQLDDDAVRALPLNDRLGHAELIDAVADHLLGPVHGVLGLFFGKIFQIHLHDQMDTALQVEPQVERTAEEIGQPGRFALFHGRFLLGGETIELKGGIEVVHPGRDEHQDEQRFPIPFHRLNPLYVLLAARPPGRAPAPVGEFALQIMLRANVEVDGSVHRLFKIINYSHPRNAGGLPTRWKRGDAGYRPR